MSRHHQKSNAPQAVKKRGVMANTFTVASWTMFSRLLGFVRDILLARVLGAGALADAFFVALKLPNFFRRMLAEGTLTVALIPVLAAERQRGEEAAHAYLNALATLLLILLLLLAVIGVVAMPWLLLLFAPGFHHQPDRWQQALLLARWMFPYLALITLSAMGWAVLNAHRRFAVAAASPALLNLAIIFAAIILAPSMANPGLALAFGVLAGGVLQLAIQIPALKRIGWRPRLSLDWQQPAIKRTLKLFFPALMGVAAVQINILIGTILATLLATGAVSYLYYADRIVQLPLALFGIAMGSALMPTLSSLLAEQRNHEARLQLQQGIGWLTWITLPATIGILILAEPIIITLFANGKFGYHDAIATAHTLQAYAIGLIPFCWAKILSAACFANQDSKAPMRYAFISVAINIVLAIILMQFWQWVGLALATSLAAIVNVLLLLRRTGRHYGSLMVASVWARIAKAASACLPMAALLLALPQLWPFPTHHKLAQCGWLALAVSGGLIIFLACAWLFGERTLINQLRRRS
ncbi:MAG: murein biosynthesis integral membrane protein MurJ [Mariprofundales bacterium]|nr:murein biosynthesis integral membrane protein MurJ [Mariprofundales bacterium]